MELSLRRWRPGQLLASWAVYWAGLAGVTLTPLLRAVWRATHLPDGHGTISAGFDNGMIHFTVIESGVKTLTSTASLGTALAWIVGPPLGLWLLWLAVRTRSGEGKPPAIGDRDIDQLSAGSPAEWQPSAAERVGVEREHSRTPNP